MFIVLPSKSRKTSSSGRKFNKYTHDLEIWYLDKAIVGAKGSHNLPAPKHPQLD
jgi:hypothetical protein